MFDPRLDTPNEYPVELTAPDITPYQAGNTGVDYIHTFQGEAPGPHVFISAVVHGNELCGAIALDWLLRRNPRPVCGRLTLGFMNTAAYAAFDPAQANLTRWLDEDFNRLWDEKVLDDSERRQTVELRRARAVRDIVGDADLLLDLHSMQTPCAPMILSGRHRKGRELAAALGMNMAVVQDGGHAEGKRMRDYGGFDDPASGKNALLIECGQNWERASADVAIEAMLRFIRHSGIMAADFGADELAAANAANAANAGEMKFYRVGQVVPVKTDRFRFVADWLGFEHLQEGELIGYDGDEAIVAPWTPTVLIMPSKRLFPGITAVRLAYPADDNIQ